MIQNYCIYYVRPPTKDAFSLSFARLPSCAPYLDPEFDSLLSNNVSDCETDLPLLDLDTGRDFEWFRFEALPFTSGNEPDFGVRIGTR
jgi:hypothetical protein